MIGKLDDLINWTLKNTYIPVYFAVCICFTVLEAEKLKHKYPSAPLKFLHRKQQMQKSKCLIKFFWNVFETEWVQRQLSYVKDRMLKLFKLFKIHEF